jgi:hypothetical protein
VVQRFNDFMLSGNPWQPVAVFFVLQPLLVLVHELGHAAVALVMTDGPVTVAIGHKRDRPPQLRLGRLSVRFTYWSSLWSALRAPAFSLPAGTAESRDVWITPARRIAIIAAGPAASLLGGAVCAVVAARVGGFAAHVLWWSAASLLIAGFASLVPWGYTDARLIGGTIRAARFVPGGATALAGGDLEALLAAVTAYVAAIAKAPHVLQEIVRWTVSVRANDERVAPAADQASAARAVVAGIVARSREDVREPLAPAVASAIAGGAADPVAAAALDRHADALGMSSKGGAEAAALRFRLVADAPSRRTALESLRWFDIGRALADVFATRSSQAPAAVAR